MLVNYPQFIFFFRSIKNAITPIVRIHDKFRVEIKFINVREFIFSDFVKNYELM